MACASFCERFQAGLVCCSGVWLLLWVQVSRLLSGAVGADKLADLMYILCNREQQIVSAFEPVFQRCLQHAATVAAQATGHSDSSTATNSPAGHDSSFKHAGDKQLQLLEPGHAASLLMHLLQTSVQRQHEMCTMLLSVALRQNPRYADTLGESDGLLAIATSGTCLRFKRLQLYRSSSRPCQMFS